MKRIKNRLLKLLSVILIVGIIFQTFSGVLLVSADEVSSGLSMQYYSGS